MQENKSKEKIEITNANSTKSVSFAMNSNNDQPVQLVAYSEEHG